MKPSRSSAASWLCALAFSGCHLFGYEPVTSADPDAALPSDASVADAADVVPGLDATAADAARVDARSSDAAPWWTGREPDLRCGGDSCDPRCEQPAQPCLVDCQGASECKARCTMGALCRTDCTEASNCSLECEASSCSLDCTDASNCDVRCRMGSVCAIGCSASNCRMECGDRTDCTLDCRGAGNCEELRCTVGSTCLVYCGGTDNCALECPGGALLSCPGNVLTCNRACP